MLKGHRRTQSATINLLHRPEKHQQDLDPVKPKEHEIYNLLAKCSKGRQEKIVTIDALNAPICDDTPCIFHFGKGLLKTSFIKHEKEFSLQQLQLRSIPEKKKSTHIKHVSELSNNHNKKCRAKPIVSIASRPNPLNMDKVIRDKIGVYLDAPKKKTSIIDLSHRSQKLKK